MRSILISVLMVVVVIVIYDSLGSGGQGEMRQFGGRYGQSIREVDP